MAQRKGPFCGAKRRNAEGTCRRDAGAGTDHKGFGRCSWHGGCSPTGSASANEQRVEDEARRELAKLDVAPVSDYLSAFAQVTGQVLAWKDVAGRMVNDLDSLRYESFGNGGGEQLRSEVALWERSLDRCEKFLSAMARMNIDERLARITEQQAEVVTRALASALSEMGFEAQQQEEARRRMARHLRAV